MERGTLTIIKNLKVKFLHARQNKWNTQHLNMKIEDFMGQLFFQSSKCLNAFLPQHKVCVCRPGKSLVVGLNQFHFSSDYPLLKKDLWAYI